MKTIIWTSHSRDGATWSLEIPASAGNAGELQKRVIWRQQGMLGQFRIQRFRGTTSLSIAKLEAEIEALTV